MPEGRLHVKMPSYQYRNPHCKDKMVSRPSYLYNENPYTQKDSLYIETGPCFPQQSSEEAVNEGFSSRFLALYLLLFIFFKEICIWMYFLTLFNAQGCKMYGYWWPGDVESQGISSHGIDLVNTWYSIACWKDEPPNHVSDDIDDNRHIFFKVSKNENYNRKHISVMKIIIISLTT